MRISTLLALVPVCAAIAATPSEAEACGGFFCDQGPQSMPVDQTGENIIFVMGGTYTEAHIQIQYDPDTAAAEFAWVVPITSVPDFAVGSDAFFQNVLGATRPTYSYNTVYDDCGWGTGDASASASGVTGGEGEDGAGDGGGSTGGDGGPDILLQETVGAFDIVVLSGGTAAEVMDWLNTNGYAQDPDAEPILGEYLAENYLFAAFKLTNGGDVAEVHPIVLTFQADEACVPLRLTRIAAQDDMEVRSFFLADSRVVPQTYKHVLLNPVKLDWPNLADNYKEILTLAVDAFGADGKAFVTEYAGASSIVWPGGIYSPTWNPQAFVGLEPVYVVDELQAQGVPSSLPMLLPLLSQYLPVPMGLTPQEFYNCLSCYQDQIDVAAWGDGSGFAMGMQDLIVAPGQHAVDLLTQFPYLTRMYTTISPAEMTADPFFWENPDLPDVDLTFQIATQRVLCNLDSVWTLPDGREVYLPQGAPWPAFDDEMPYEEVIEETPVMGPPIGLVDNSALIDTKVAEYNCQYYWPTPIDCGSNPGGTGTSGNTGSDADGGADTGSDGGQSGSGGIESPSGCGCASDRGRAGMAWLALAFAGVASRRRRRSLPA